MGVNIMPIRQEDIELVWDTFDFYSSDSAVDSENFDEFKFMFKPEGLAGKGNILYFDGKPAAYAFLTSIDRERVHYHNGTLPGYFARAWDRVDWDKVANDLEKILGSDVSFWHLQDYASLPEYRGKGLAKQVLTQTLDELDESEIKVGFIALNRPNSIPASSKSGNVYTGVVPQAYDGPHPALVSVCGKRLKIDYKGEVIPFDPVETLAERVKEEIAKGLVVGYDKQSSGLRAGTIRA